MKHYMGFSKSAGAYEGACLIFADSWRQARNMAWKSVIGLELADSFLDISVRLIRDSPWLDKEAKSSLPHVIDDPKHCKRCEMWGESEIGVDGLCEGCREFLEATE